jgi:hypothetical protein
MPAELKCHSCGRPHVSQLGGDLHCSPACQQAAADQVADVCKQMEACGFYPGEVANLWEKGGIHISLEQVMREGLEATLQKHADALAEQNS